MSELTPNNAKATPLRTFCRGLAVSAAPTVRHRPTSLCPEGAATCQPRGSDRESCERSRSPGLAIQIIPSALKGRNNRHRPVLRFPDVTRYGARSMIVLKREQGHASPLPAVVPERPLRSLLLCVAVCTCFWPWWFVLANGTTHRTRWHTRPHPACLGGESDS
jgi:hypothetical protein